MLTNSRGELTHASILVIGDKCTGKSRLIERYLDPSNADIEEYKPTLLDTNSIENVVYNQLKDSEGLDIQKLNLQISEVGGGHEELLDRAIQSADGFMIVYDITNQESFKSCFDYYKAIISHKYGRKTPELLPILIIGTKIDLLKKRKVTYDMGQELASVLQTMFMECTCLAPTSVNASFKTMVSKITEIIEITQKVSESPEKPTKSKGLASLKSLFIKKESAPVINEIQPSSFLKTLDSRVWLPKFPLQKPQLGTLRSQIELAQRQREKTYCKPPSESSPQFSQALEDALDGMETFKVSVSPEPNRFLQTLEVELHCSETSKLKDDKDNLHSDEHFTIAEITAHYLET